MSDRDKDQEDQFSLEDVLAEFGSGKAKKEGTPVDPGEAFDPASFDAAFQEARAELLEREEALEREKKPETVRLSHRAADGESPQPPTRETEPSPSAPEEAEPPRDWREDTIPFPVDRRRRAEPSPGEKKGVITAFPGTPRPQEEPEEEKPPVQEESYLEEEGEETVPPDLSEEEEAREPHHPAETPQSQEDKVLEFPGRTPENPVAAGLDQLRRKADEFAGHMYEEEGVEAAKSVRRAEKLIPGVDEEVSPAPKSRERKPRKVLPPPPDIPPADLAKRYAKGMKGARVRNTLIFLCLLPLTYLTLAPDLSLPLPDILVGNALYQCYGLAALQGLIMLLSLDGLWKGLSSPFRGLPGLDTVTALANLVVLADALTLPLLTGGAMGRQPFCLPAAFSLWCVQVGNRKKRRGQRLACRTAASVSQPYLVTRDEGKWNGRDTYVKWSGTQAGFGSQIQSPDGAERIYRVVAPLLLLASLLFALIASVGNGKAENFLWCWSATLVGASSLSATLCFGIPWCKLSLRLTRSGAALAGWQGVTNTTGSANLLLTDTDLFPAGTVTMNGVKIFGDFPIDKVVSFTATAIRDAGSGLEKVFYDLLRSQGTIYRRGSEFTAYEGGGVSEIIQGQQVLVGSASFMVLMEVALPPGLKVKNAVFCAIDGDLAGIFALSYHLPGTVPQAIDSLIHNHITPVLATRDFNLIPSMLRLRFKLPVEKMEFPPVERRRELSTPEQDHSDTLTALLCREGVAPCAEAVVGGRRLRSAVRLSAVLACLGSLVGELLAFYLTFVTAYAALTPMNLTVFLLMWLVPTLLISGWVDRY